MTGDDLERPFAPWRVRRPHDHYGYAAEFHRHYDDENTVAGLREDLGRAQARIADLEDAWNDVLCRIGALEDSQRDEVDEPESDPAVADYLDSLERDAFYGPHFYAAPEEPW